MNVDSGVEGFAHGLVPAEVRKDSQFNLRVVSADQRPLRIRGLKRSTHLASFRCADRDVLQVGVAGAESSGGGHCLVKGGMNATGLRGDQFGECVEVGALQFDQVSTFEDLFGQRMLCRQFLEDFLVCAGTGLSFADDGQFEFGEQDLPQLFG